MIPFLPVLRPLLLALALSIAAVTTAQAPAAPPEAATVDATAAATAEATAEGTAEGGTDDAQAARAASLDALRTLGRAAAGREPAADDTSADGSVDTPAAPDEPAADPELERTFLGGDEETTDVSTVPAPETPLPEPDAAAPPASADDAAFRAELGELEVLANDGGVSAFEGGEIVWTFSFPAGSGRAGGLLAHDGGIVHAHGISVLRFGASGDVERRWIVSGPVHALEADGEDILVHVEHAAGGVAGAVRETFTIRGGELQEVVRFGTEPRIFGFLAAEANVADPAARLERDPTNPWLHLQVPATLLEGAPEDARAAFRRAADAAQTFFDLAGAARVIHTAGHPDLAADAFDRALEDFAARGYHPRLLRDAELEAAYNFPLGPLRRATAAGELERAEFWAERVRVASQNVPGAREALGAHANALAIAGQTGRAAVWREAAAAVEGRGAAEGLQPLFVRLATAGWAAAAALIATIAILHLVFVAKYWFPQTQGLWHAKRRRSRLAGRFFAMRYYSFFEKLTLVMLFALALFFASLGAWRDAGGVPPAVMDAGTLASAEARAMLADPALDGPRGAFLRGYAAQVAGEREAAEAFYLAAGRTGPALNNLGVLRGDETLFEQALAVSPGMPEARRNLGLQAQAFPFDERYRDDSVLVVPLAEDVSIARAGSSDEAIGAAFTNPWTALEGARPVDVHPWLWWAFLALLFAWALATIVWLFVPRPAFARNAPRSWVYHVLAVLVPGSGQADEAWGILLVVPWALLGLQALSLLYGWGAGLGLGLEVTLSLLALVYIVNVVTFAVEWMAYRRRLETPARPPARPA